MAEKRMFAKTIIDSDAFLDMPSTAQNLYFHLGMRADDEGFINNPKRIQRMVGASEDDLRILIGKNFVIPFESGVVVIKHWKIHNYIRRDRQKDTAYQQERKLLAVKSNGAYTTRIGADDIEEIAQFSTNGDGCAELSANCLPTVCQPSVNRPSNVSVDKIRLDKIRTDIDKDITPPIPPLRGNPSNKDLYLTYVSEHDFSEMEKALIVEWLDYKTARKQKYVDGGMKQLLTKFSNGFKKYGYDVMAEAIHESMSNMWTGFFPEKTQTAKPSTKQSLQRTSARDVLEKMEKGEI